jgi:hypothetical protein
MALPTNTHLLATGLEPVEHPDCAICKEPMTEPFRVPCNGKHAFCKACITTWLGQSGKTSCPMCRQVLCTAPANDRGVHQPRDSRRFQSAAQDIHVYDAFRASGLASSLSPYARDNPPLTELVRFSDEIRLGSHLLRRLAPLARSMLTSTLTARREGALLIDAERLGACLILTGNIVMRTAANDHRGWSDANKQTWEAMLLVI